MSEGTGNVLTRLVLGRKTSSSPHPTNPNSSFRGLRGLGGRVCSSGGPAAQGSLQAASWKQLRGRHWRRREEPRSPWSAAVTSSVDGWLGSCVHPSWTLGCPQCMAAADLGPSQQVRQSYQEQRLCGHVCGVRLCVCTWCLCVWCVCGTCAEDPGKATFQHHPHSSPQQPGKLWLPHQGRGVLTLL